MNIHVFLDFLVPIIGFFIVQDNLDAVRNLLGAGGAVLERWHAKLTLLFTHDLVVFFRRSRLRMLYAETLVVVTAICLFFAAKGYCGNVVLPWYMLVALVPAIGTIVVGLIRVVQDREVRSVPLYLAEFKAYPDDQPIDPPANPNDPVQVAAHDAAVQVRAQEVERRLLEFGPRDRSPMPHAWAMIYSPLIVSVCVAILAAWMGLYGTFALRGLERHWAMLVALDAYLCYILAGVGYKVVIGVGRAILLRVTDAVAPGVNVTLRTLATILPTIDAANAATRVPAFTGQIIHEFADLSEGLENRPIAKFELAFVMNALLPDPRVLFITTVAALVIKADDGNQVAEGIDVTAAQRDRAMALSPWLRWIMRLSLVAFFVGTISRDSILPILEFFRGLLNPLLSLGYPEDVVRIRAYHWILPVLWGLIVVAVFAAISRVQALPDPFRAIARAIAVTCLLVIVMNITRGSRFQIGDDNIALLTACPEEREEILARRPHPAPVVMPLPLDPNLPVPQPPTPAPPPSVSAPVAVGYGSPSAGRLARRSRHRRRHDGETVLAADVDTGSDPFPGTVACTEVAPDLRDSLRAARACHD